LEVFSQRIKSKFTKKINIKGKNERRKPTKNIKIIVKKKKKLKPITEKI
jgi:hypothetical protein